MNIATAKKSLDTEALSGSSDSDARETARMLKTLITNIDGMVYRCHNDSQWTMEFVSDGCLAVTGYGPEDLLLNHTISYEQLTHPEDRMRVRGNIILRSPDVVIYPASGTGARAASATSEKASSHPTSVAPPAWKSSRKVAPM